MTNGVSPQRDRTEFAARLLLAKEAIERWIRPNHGWGAPADRKLICTSDESRLAADLLRELRRELVIRCDAEQSPVDGRELDDLIPHFYSRARSDAKVCFDRSVVDGALLCLERAIAAEARNAVPPGGNATQDRHGDIGNSGSDAAVEPVANTFRECLAHFRSWDALKARSRKFFDKVDGPLNKGTAAAFYHIEGCRWDQEAAKQHAMGMALDGYGRLQAICEAELGSVTTDRLTTLRGRLAMKLGCGSDDVDKMTLVEFADRWNSQDNFTVKPRGNHTVASTDADSELTVTDPEAKDYQDQEGRWVHRQWLEANNIEPRRVSDSCRKRWISRETAKRTKGREKVTVWHYGDVVKVDLKGNP